jgi:hypothetical protein
MGKSETASTSLGIKILLSDLVSQINETNFTLIKKMLYDGCIEDSNGYFNEAYKTILGYDDGDIQLPEQYDTFKDYVTEQFKIHGSYYKSKFSRKVEPDLENGCLLEKYLLVPIKELLETERWGYGRYGINSASRQIDFDLSIDLEEYTKNNIEKYKKVFIVKQHSG